MSRSRLAHNPYASDTNDLGQTVGWAENTVRDPTCVAPQVLQFRAVVWGPRNGQIRELPPLPGDSVSAATALNDRGQVVGISGICDQAAGRFSAIHNVLWENGKPIDIGDCPRCRQPVRGADLLVSGHCPNPNCRTALTSSCCRPHEQASPTSTSPSWVRSASSSAWRWPPAPGPTGELSATCSQRS